MRELTATEAQTKLFVKADNLLKQVRDSDDLLQGLIDMDAAFLQRVIEIAVRVAEEEENYEQCHTLHTSLTSILAMREEVMAERN